MNYQEFEKFVEDLSASEKSVRIKDGVYDTTDITFIVKTNKNTEEVVAWINEREKVWIANAYGTDEYIFFEEEPAKFDGKWYGSGFNYGSTNVLTDCPKSILILAEND
jgi:hypothetical protein